MTAIRTERPTAAPAVPGHEPALLPRNDRGERQGREPLVLDKADVRRHNAEVAHRLKTQGAVRPQVGFFRCPWPVTATQYARIRDAAVKKWIGYMEKTGWRLESQVLDFPQKRRTAAATSGDWYGIPILDQVEVPVAAYFKKLDMEIQRVEVPVAAE